MRYIQILLIIFVASCSSIGSKELSKVDLFVGVDWSELSEDEVRVLKESSADYNAVLSGLRPIYAKIDENRLSLDGGTRFYNGFKYKLTVVQSMSGFGRFHGYVYGPSIQFDDGFAPGNVSKLSNLKMYSRSEIKRLLKR